METQVKRIKISLRIAAIIVIATGSSLLLSHSLDAVRTVDFIQIFAFGIAFGVLMVNAVMLKRMRS